MENLHENFYMKILESEECLKESQELQEKIYTKLLDENHGSFIIKKDEEVFKAMRDGKNGMTVGVFNKQDQLIGQSSVNFLDVSKEPPYSDNQLNIIKDTKIFEVNGILMDPEYTNLGLAEKMNKFLISECEKKFNDEEVLLVFEIEMKNGPSLNLAINKLGFIAKQIYTASDGAICYLLYKSVGKNELLKEGVFDKSNVKEVKIHDSFSIISLIKNSYSISNILIEKDKEKKKVIKSTLVFKKLSKTIIKQREGVLNK